MNNRCECSLFSGVLLALATGTQQDVEHADFEAAMAEVQPSLTRGAEVDLAKGREPSDTLCCPALMQATVQSHS